MQLANGLKIESLAMGCCNKDHVFLHGSFELPTKEYTNDKIAKELTISYRTVESHRKNIMQKTKANNLAGLIKYAYSKGLIK